MKKLVEWWEPYELRGSRTVLREVKGGSALFLLTKEVKFYDGKNGEKKTYEDFNARLIGFSNI